MKTSLTQVKKQSGLLTVVLVIALLNGALDTITPLTTIVLAAHRSTMLIGTYSFTIALFWCDYWRRLCIGFNVWTTIIQKINSF